MGGTVIWENPNHADAGDWARPTATTESQEGDAA